MRRPRDPAAVCARQPSGCSERRDPRALARVQHLPSSPQPVRGVQRVPAEPEPTHLAGGRTRVPGQPLPWGSRAPVTQAQVHSTRTCPRRGVSVSGLNQQTGSQDTKVKATWEPPWNSAGPLTLWCHRSWI